MDVHVNTKNRFTKHRWVQHATTCQKHADNVKDYTYTNRSRTRNHQSKEHPWVFLGVCQHDNGDAGSNPPTTKRAAQLCQGVVLNPQRENIWAALKLYHKYSALPDTIIMQEFGTTLSKDIFSLLQ
jgi:hypothetical protein